MRVLRWLRSIGRALSLAVLALSALYLLLQTTIGRGWITALIESAASSPGQAVTIERLEGRLPDAPHVGRVFVSDSEGVWLALQDVTLEWSPLALLRGRTIVDGLTAQRVEWRRRPEPTVAETTSSSDGGLPKLAIRNLEISELSIAPEVAGRGGIFAVKGNADLLDPATRTQLNLAATEKSGNGARATLALDYESAANRLIASGNIADRAGGTLAAMLGLPSDAPLNIALQSNGPLDRWRATLTGSGGSALNMQGKATIDHRGEWREATVNLTSTIGAIGPERLRTLYEGASTIDIAAAQNGNGAWRIDRLKAQTPALSADGQGAFDPARQRADGELTLRAPSGDTFSALAGNAHWRDLNVTAKLHGGWPKPTLLVDATAADVAHSDISASALNAHIEAQPDRPWNDEEARIAITSRVAAAGMRAADPMLNKALANRASLTLQGTLVDRARLTGVASELTAAGLVARFAGDAGPAAIAGVLSIGAPDLTKAGLKSGRVALQSNLDADFDDGTITAEGKGTLENVALDSDVDGLLAGKQNLAFALSGPFKDLRLTALTLEGSHISFTASGALRPDALSIDAHATMSDLAALAPEHAGRAETTVRVTGTADAPRIEATAALTAGKLFGRPVQSLKVALAPADGNDLSRFTITGDYNGKAVDGVANVAWQAKGGATIDALRVQFASVGVVGAAEVDGRGLIRGQARVDIGDLADVGPLIDEDIAGPLNGDIRFAPANGQQNATIALATERFRIDKTTLSGLNVSGNASDLFGSLGLALRAKAANADLDGFTLENLDATGNGPLGVMALTARANQGATRVDARGTLKVAGKPTIIVVDTLQLARDDKTARLTNPIEISIGNHRVLVPPTRIASGGGEAVLSGDAGRATELNVSATTLPLWVADFTAPQPLPLTGMLSGTAKIGKHGATDFDVKVANFAPTIEPRLVRNLTLTATGKTDRAGADVKLTLADAGRTSFRAAGRVPFTGNGAFALDVDGTADLALANAYLGVTGDRARGALTVAAKLAGTLNAPRIEGSAKIANGAFRSAESGFELRNIDATLTGSERNVTVSALTAQAPNGGTVAMKGNIKLAPAEGYPIDLTVTARQAQLVSTELTTIVGDVDAHLTGAIARQAQVSGLAVVDRWDIRLREKLARPLTPIRVTHRNAPADLTTEVEREEPESALQLGLGVTVRAPRRVFVRGQGVDAEFGGQVKVTGTVDNPVANGRFELRRGAVTALSQRIALTRGDITFAGGAIPTLDIAGEVRKSDLTATVAVKGKATAPQVTLSSTPTLPQDEIIARLLFNKSVQQLSAFEAAQLAATIARWSGLASGPDILESLRSVLGIDALSAVTDTAGGTAVSAGTYVGRGVYVGLVQGADATAGRATVDIDLNERVKVRGEVAPSGDTRVGVVAEWEY